MHALSQSGKRRWICTACNARIVIEEMCVSGKLPDETTVCDVCGTVGGFQLTGPDEVDRWLNLVSAAADGVDCLTDAEVAEELAEDKSCPSR